MVVRRPLCKKCHKRPRRSLYYCKECLKEHNEQTKKLKRKYRASNKCVMCGSPSSTRRCNLCQETEQKQQKNRPYSKSKLSKKGTYGSIKQISEVI